MYAGLVARAETEEGSGTMLPGGRYDAKRQRLTRRISDLRLEIVDRRGMIVAREADRLETVGCM